MTLLLILAAIAAISIAALFRLRLTAFIMLFLLAMSVTAVHCHAQVGYPDHPQPQVNLVSGPIWLTGGTTGQLIAVKTLFPVNSGSAAFIVTGMDILTSVSTSGTGVPVVQLVNGAVALTNTNTPIYSGTGTITSPSTVTVNGTAGNLVTYPAISPQVSVTGTGAVLSLNLVTACTDPSLIVQAIIRGYFTN